MTSRRIASASRVVALLTACGAVAFAMPIEAQVRSQTEGIKVHGHWVIEVRNPDGTLVSRTAFENSLTTTGATVIANVLGKVEAITWWEIRVGDACGGPGTPRPCYITEAARPKVGVSSYSYNLVVDAASQPGSLILSGSVIAEDDDDILTVGTGAVMPSQGGNIAGVVITLTTITSIAVVAGQQIVATVTLSFN